MYIWQAGNIDNEFRHISEYFSERVSINLLPGLETDT